MADASISASKGSTCCWKAPGSDNTLPPDVGAMRQAVLFCVPCAECAGPICCPSQCDPERNWRDWKSGRPTFEFTGSARLHRAACVGFLGRASFALAAHPAAADRKDLPDKATRWFAAKIGSEFSVFLGSHEAPQGNFTLQAFLKSRVGLNVRRENLPVGRSGFEICT